MSFSAILPILWVLCSYLVGSIPFGVVVTRFLGTQDPRTGGSHNIGFTNVLRVCGKQAGYGTLAGDAGKGLFVVVIALALGLSGNMVLMSAFAVVCGHIFSIFLGLKGGKGVATALGAIFGVHWLLGLGLLGIWLLAVGIFKISSGGALCAFLAFPALVYFFAYDPSLLVFSISVTLLILFRHKENISRILDGTEGKMNISS